MGGDKMMAKLLLSLLSFVSQNNPERQNEPTPGQEVVMLCESRRLRPLAVGHQPREPQKIGPKLTLWACKVGLSMPCPRRVSNAPYKRGWRNCGGVKREASL